MKKIFLILSMLATNLFVIDAYGMEAYNNPESSEDDVEVITPTYQTHPTSSSSNPQYSQPAPDPRDPLAPQNLYQIVNFKKGSKCYAGTPKPSFSPIIEMFIKTVPIGHAAFIQNATGTFGGIIGKEAASKLLNILYSFCSKDAFETEKGKILKGALQKNTIQLKNIEAMFSMIALEEEALQKALASLMQQAQLGDIKEQLAIKAEFQQISNDVVEINYQLKSLKENTKIKEDDLTSELNALEKKIAAARKSPNSKQQYDQLCAKKIKMSNELNSLKALSMKEKILLKKTKKQYLKRQSELMLEQKFFKKSISEELVAEQEKLTYQIKNIPNKIAQLRQEASSISKEHEKLLSEYHEEDAKKEEIVQKRQAYLTGGTLAVLTGSCAALYYKAPEVFSYFVTLPLTAI